jgi:UPF0716 protein FxsA
MLNPLMLICLALPLLELVVLVKLGQAIGFWNTVLILLAMAVLGGLLLHRQGWKALQQAQTAMMEGQPPVGPMLDGMLLATAGALLIGLLFAFGFCRNANIYNPGVRGQPNCRIVQGLEIADPLVDDAFAQPHTMQYADLDDLLK